MVFDQRTSTFTFREGPVFTNVLIGDEINRGSPKTQSALLEVMEERQVTADGVSRRVARPFFVIATQNPRDFQGTFPLPDVQLDRFAMRLTLGYADADTEVSILEEYHRHSAQDDLSTGHRSRGTRPGDQRDRRRRRRPLDRRLHRADRQRHPNPPRSAPRRVDTRDAHDAACGPSLRRHRRTRLRHTRRRQGRVSAPVFAHRMALTAEAELRGVRIENALADIIDEVPVPRSREG